MKMSSLTKGAENDYEMTLYTAQPVLCHVWGNVPWRCAGSQSRSTSKGNRTDSERRNRLVTENCINANFESPCKPASLRANKQAYTVEHTFAYVCTYVLIHVPSVDHHWCRSHYANSIWCELKFHFILNFFISASLMECSINWHLKQNLKKSENCIAYEYVSWESWIASENIYDIFVILCVSSTIKVEGVLTLITTHQYSSAGYFNKKIKLS